jgi:hypothetical protein
MYKNILLVSSTEDIALPYGSKINILTSRDPKAVKVFKYLKSMEIDSILRSSLEGNEIKKFDLVVLFHESKLKIEKVISFCKNNNCDLMILKHKAIKFKNSYNIKIMHFSNLQNYIEITNKIVTEIKNSL